MLNQFKCCLSNLINSNAKACQTSSWRFISMPSLNSNYIKNLIGVHRHDIEASVSARKYPINTELVFDEWNKMMKLHHAIKELEIQKDTVSQKYKNLVFLAENSNNEEIRFLKYKGKQIRIELKEMNKRLQDVENNAVFGILSLPNILHPKTPLTSKNTVVTEAPSKTNYEQYLEEYLDHIFKSLHSPSSLYVRDCISEELLNCIDCTAQNLTTNGFIKATTPDFVKPTVLLGCGFPWKSLQKSFYCLKNDGNLEGPKDEMVLVGGGSLYALVAFLMKCVIENPFPLRLFCTGRSYIPETAITQDSSETLSSNTTSGIRLLSLTANCLDDMYKEIERIQHIVCEQLKSQSKNFLIEDVCAQDLHPWEQYRCVFKVDSPWLNKFVTAAEISLIGDYISRRLSIYAGPCKTPPGMVTAYIAPK